VLVFNITSFVHKIKIDEHSPIFSLKNLWEGIMKKQFLKTALITMAVVGVMSGSAMAITAPAPMLEGGLSMTGAWNPIDIDGVETTIPLSTGIDFSGWFDGVGAPDNTFLVTTGTGSFAALGGNISGIINDFQFDTPLVTESLLWSVGGFSFTMSSFEFEKDIVDGNNDLHVYGLGTLSATGFADTPGQWNFTGQ
jgi:hypothetical protein